MAMMATQLSAERSPDRLAIDLADTFASLDGFSIFGHGTDPHALASISVKGLEAKFAHLGSTTVPLSDSQKSTRELVESIIKQCESWPHRNSKGVVLIALPNAPEGQRGGSAYFDSVFERIEGVENESGFSNEFRIPAQYIVGTIDMTNRTFSRNEHFDPTPITIAATEASFTTPDALQDLGISRVVPQGVVIARGSADDIW